MKRLLVAVIVFLGITCIYLEMSNESTLVTHPKGFIAHQELALIRTNILWMLLVIVPTLIWLLATAWKYRSQNERDDFDPEATSSPLTQVLLWVVPSCVIAVMCVITWKAAHRLDPYKPLFSNVKPLTIQVVALDWKWLFIYPEQNIATVNFVQYPENTPIQFKLTADGAPMNSFWLPQMSGQIYAMTGMCNTLNIIADASGVYRGRAVEINGDGYADMTFMAKSCSNHEFEDWVKQVKSSPMQLNQAAYSELSKRSIPDHTTLYASVEDDLFNKIIMKYMEP